jgi:cell division protein FtsW (lipid II flippase)
MITLMVVGVTAIREATMDLPKLRGLADSQLAYAIVGGAAFVAMSLTPYQRVGRLAYVLAGATLLLLVGVFFTPAVRGSHRWIDLGSFSIQPSEVAKLSYIIMLAWYLRYGDNYRRLRGLVLPFVLTLAPLGLILKEPDLGTSLLFLPTLYFMLFIAGARMRHLLGIVALGTVLVFWPVWARLPTGVPRALDRAPLSYYVWQGHDGPHAIMALPIAVLEDHQIRRINGWLRQNDPQVVEDEGFQLHRAKLLLGSGCASGRGEWDPAGRYNARLPDGHTDFIFSVIGGKWGFVGCLATLFLYAVIFLFGAEIAVATYDPFGRLLAVGVLALLFSQLFINVGMTLGLLPVTGMTLPLVSYGGSSLVINCAALGLLVNVGVNRPILLGKRPFEHGERPPKEHAVSVGRGQA